MQSQICPSFTGPVMQDKWEIPRENLSIKRLVGDGEYGVVFEASLKTAQGGPLRVAIKKPKEDSKTLSSELQVMKQVRPHNNIVNLIGACTLENGPLYIVTEFEGGGTLLNYLRKGRSLRSSTNDVNANDTVFMVTDKELITFAVDVARGVSHVVEEGFVHGDLAARNVLLTQERVAKVSDFGFSSSHVATDYESVKRHRVPVKWMAPELLLDNVCNTSQSDVWAFGVLLWEMFTLGGSPYPGISAQRLSKYLSSGQRLEKPVECCDEVYDVMQCCWRWEPGERSTFVNILDSLQTILGSCKAQPQCIMASKFDTLYPYFEMDSCNKRERLDNDHDIRNENLSFDTKL